ncbi:hypothetical protein BJX76DRAFT_348341 [Aspergillus varians]
MLKPHGVAVAGGRSDSAGVGGLIIEALKVSGSNLGTVTKVELRAFPQGPLWGGITALVNFTSNLANNPHAMLVTIWQNSGQANASFAASSLQYKLGVKDAPIFSEFLAIPQTFSSLRVTDIYDLMMETAPPPGKRALFFTLTFRNEARVLERLRYLQEEAASTMTSSGVRSEDWDVVRFLQPFPSILGKTISFHSWKGKQVSRKWVLYLLFLSWGNEADDILFHDIGYETIDKLKAYTREISADSDFIYMNYAGREQNPLRGYGEGNFGWINAMARKYDPIGVFQRQVPGGFKVSGA